MISDVDLCFLGGVLLHLLLILFRRPLSVQLLKLGRLQKRLAPEMERKAAKKGVSGVNLAPYKDLTREQELKRHRLMLLWWGIVGALGFAAMWYLSHFGFDCRV